jgi:alcohol dehydrogenase YqhD (iron-dependent ADH family)
MNSFSVLTKPEDQKKWAFGSPFTYPKVSIIDPAVQMTLPWRQTVNGGVDSLSHVMENYFGGIDEETTLSINEALMVSVIKSIDKLQVDYHNYHARADFAWASALALSGLTSLSMRGGEWVVHRIEHGISALFPKVAHAEGLAVLFPAWIRYVSQNKPGIFERWSSKVWGESTIDGGVNAFQNKLRQWQAPITLGDLGVSESDIPAIAENAFMQGPLGKIKEIHYEDMVNILKLAL